MSETAGIALLRAAGWHEGRSVGVQGVLSAISGAGFEIWPELVGMLTEYAGLRVVSADDASRFLALDPEQALDGLGTRWVDAYHALAGCELIPLGQWQDLTVLAGRDGRLYGGRAREFGPLGHTVPELAQSLLTEVPPRPLTMRVA
jgi:SUKH-3 immunity protein